MTNKNDFINRMDEGLEEFDAEMIKALKKIEKTYPGSEVPNSIKSKINQLVDLRKDFADKIQEMKAMVDSSWESLEKDSRFMLKELTQFLKSFPKD